MKLQGRTVHRVCDSIRLPRDRGSERARNRWSSSACLPLPASWCEENSFSGTPHRPNRISLWVPEWSKSRRRTADMKVYLGGDIRNVAIVGHAHCGKTTLVAALLHAARMTATQGRVEDGSAVTAYDEEEVARRTTMSNATAFAEWNGVKINLIDTPGFHMFAHETRAAMLPVEVAAVVVNAQTGAEAGTDRVWEYAAEVNLPRGVVLNQ